MKYETERVRERQNETKRDRERQSETERCRDKQTDGKTDVPSRFILIQFNRIYERKRETSS
jgi:hypothetical protein